MSHFAGSDRRGAPASPSDVNHNTDHRQRVSPIVVDESPTVGRLTSSNSALSSIGSLPSHGSRSPRMPMPSPLSAASNAQSGPSSASPSQRAFPLANSRSDVRDSEPEDNSAAHTTFYSDSSEPPSPEPTSPNFPVGKVTNELRSASDPLNSKAAQGLPKSPRPPMAGPVAVVQGDSANGLPRNSSIDSAISAVSSSKNHSQKGTPDAQPRPTDVAKLIKSAGSPEAVIQYLLKEKSSQAQQNSQLWRLVDKQRAMILGLNKDLERAVKEREKYKIKLKEVMGNQTVTKPSEIASLGAAARTTRQGANVPRVDVHAPREQATSVPDSPTLESPGLKSSPIDVTMAPYPITPPADQIAASPTAVGEMLNPSHAMPKHQEHALDRYDHEADDKAEERSRRERNEAKLKEIPFSVSLPPSRSLPSEPPKMPPPKPPATHSPTTTVFEAKSPPTEGLSDFPAPPPRKAPPAPLQLKQDLRPHLVPPEDEDTDSDYDDILEVDEIVTEKRGRRRTRAEDDRIREILAFKEAEARSASKKSKLSQPESPSEDLPPDARTMPQSLGSDNGPASLDAVLIREKPREVLAPALNPGLPASPRPVNLKSPYQTQTLTPRSGTFPAAPLSPRPPRQPIPMPPGAAQPTPTASTSSPGPTGPSVQPLNIVKKGAESIRSDSPTKTPTTPSERNVIYKGLVTEEYPDLLMPPNALPSIAIRVASSRMKPSRASLISLTQLEEDPVFTLAVISRAGDGELWRVEKDSASLAKLDQRLKQCPTFTARTPDRSLFSGHSPAKLDARRLALEEYLEELVNTPLDTATAVELCKYLSTNTLPPYADETGSAGKPGAENSSHNVGPDGRPHRSGYLTKKGKNFGGWKARFFVLEGPFLKYFETPGGAHLGTIKLQNAQIGKQAHSNGKDSPQSASLDDSDHQYRHAFLILEPKKKDSSSHVKHVLCAESDRERDIWVDALLQWIDYRDPDDTDTSSLKGPVQDRQAPAASERQGVKIKKNNQSRAQHQQMDSDTLVGVRYDSVNAGEAPQGAPPRHRSGGGLAEQPSSHSISSDTMSSQTSKAISAPKDPQVISDSAAWGSKAALVIPNEEKKQRKRSFFGFGPKTRSSSDGQDSLFGGSEAGSAATPPQGGYQGPVKQVFGAPLAEAVRYNSPVDVDVPLPSVVYRCIQYLDDKNAVLEEGIFRLSGSNVLIKQLRERFNNEGDVNLVTDSQYHDIHAVASLLKLYLRELPTTILTRDLHLQFLATTEMPNREEKLQVMSELARRLPLANDTLLKYLIAFLIKIINNSDVNKMTVRNVGIVFSPTLNIPAPVFAMFLQHYEEIFGIDPDDYELPSPTFEAKAFDHPDGPMRFDPPTARPSTSSGSASPHRHRMESMREFQRSSPTPPLMNFNGPRGSPTPPLVAARQGYEPCYLPQHGSQPSNLRAAYDTGAPSSSQDDQGVGYTAYDQSYNSGRSRRESAMYMGSVMGLQPQGSKSRLREETRF